MEIIKKGIVYQDKSSKKWSYRIVYKNNAGKIIDKRKSGIKTKKEARLLLLNYEIENNINSNTLFENCFEKSKDVLDGNIINLTLGYLFEQYIEYSKNRLKSSSLKSASDCLRKYVLSYFGENTDVGTIKAAKVLSWQNDLLSKNFSYKYNSKIYCSFTALINFGVKYFDVPYNVVEKVGNFKNKKPKKEMNFWTLDEFLLFYNKNNDDLYRLFFTLLYFTGLRKGEAVALCWKDINFETKEISVNKSVNRKIPDLVDIDRTIKKDECNSSVGWHFVGNRVYEITSTKTTSSSRRVLLSDNIYQELVNHYEFSKKCYGFNDDWFVFGGETPLTDQTIRRRMNEMADRAGIKRIRVHDLRHSHASLLINNNHNILIVAKRLGHSDIKQTLNTYSHLMPNVQNEIVDAINIKLN